MPQSVPLNAEAITLETQRSVLGRPWQLSINGAQWRQAAALAQSCGLPLVVAQLLVGRGHTALPAIEPFLNPRLDQLPDPHDLKDAHEAAVLIADAIVAGQKIAIFGDYDVDGTCATALVTRYLRALGVEPYLYIPDRLTEGYGPNVPAMDTIAGQGARLLITVDTGTTATAPMQRAHQLGLSVVITDHHQPSSGDPSQLPLYGENNAALVNPHRPDDTSGLTNLCGSGVAFFVLIALNRELRSRGYFTENKKEPRLTQQLDLVALATVAEVMTLTGVNRVLVQKGLQQLASWQHRGLAALAGIAGVKDAVDVTTLGFHLGPRLNAAGRIDSARLALNLLLEDTDEVRARHLAGQLDELNRQRQGIEKQVLAEAYAQAEALPDLHSAPVLVLYGEGWHPGVVGIVAARVKERYNRPAFILGFDGIHLKGSARGIQGLDLGAAVKLCQEHLVSGGGHAMAAGLALEKQHLPSFCAALATAMQQQIDAHPHFAARTSAAHIPLSTRLQPTLTVDAVLTPGAVNAKLAEQLMQLAPYGHGHPEPLLVLTGCTVSYSKYVGSAEEHLKLTLADGSGTRLDAICFGAANNALGQVLTQSGGRPLTIAGHLRARTFNGRSYVDFQVRDAHLNWTAGNLRSE